MNLKYPVHVTAQFVAAGLVKHAKANVAAGTTDAALVAAVVGKKLAVTSFRLHCGGTSTTCQFNSKSDDPGVAISEVFACAANGGRAEPYNPGGHFMTNTGEGLTFTTGAGSTVGVGVTYIEVPT